MPLSANDRAELDRLGIENVRLKLAYAGPGAGSVVPGCGPGFGMTRGNVEEWLAEQLALAEKRDRQRFETIRGWTIAAAVAGIVAAVGGAIAAIASVIAIWPIKH